MKKLDLETAYRSHPLHLLPQGNLCDFSGTLVRSLSLSRILSLINSNCCAQVRCNEEASGSWVSCSGQAPFKEENVGNAKVKISTHAKPY